MKLAKVLLIITIILVNTESVGAFTQRDLNEYNLYKTEYSLTIQRLKTLKKTVALYNQKKALAEQIGDNVSSKRYIAKLEDAKFQKYELTEYLADVSDELDCFDELTESSIAKI